MVSVALAGAVGCALVSRTVDGPCPVAGSGGFLLSLVLAFLTMRFIENPLRFATAMRRSPKLSLTVGAAATAVAVGVGVTLYAPDPVGRGPAAPSLDFTASTVPAGSGMAAYDKAVEGAFGQVQAAVAASTALKAVPSNLQPSLADTVKNDPHAPLADCLRGIFQDGQPGCATGDLGSPTTAALVGDSDALMWIRCFSG